MKKNRTIIDIALIVALIACVIAISAHAPSTTYAYAQLQQIGAVVGTVQSGDWLLPRDQMGGLARKPQLYAWLDAPVLMLTGIYNDFVFRLPTVLASLVTGVLVYSLGRRWYGRRAGLLAACLWVCSHHMAKLMYVAVTDMMFTMWITASIVCADRLLFHRAAGQSRRRWLVGLWVTMIFAAMTKGWGVVNLILVGGVLGLATAVGPGFGVVRTVGGAGGKLLVVVRLILRRWGRAMKATRFGWGMAAMAAVLAPVWIGMFARGGREFRQIVYFEFYQRITGRGAAPPHGASVPAAGYLLYYMLPITVFAIGAMVLVRPRRWVSRNSPIGLPLCWIVAVVAPFSLTHGFRPDYLLPCYAAAALMGAWAIEEVLRRGPGAGAVVSRLRHLFAAAALVVAALLVVVPAMFCFHEYMPRFIAKNLKLPAHVAPETWWILAGLIPAGAAGLVIAVRASLRWRVRRVAVVAIVGMLGVMFVDRHMFSRHARTGDGERLMRFGKEARPVIGGDEFAVCRAEKLGTELYIGRFGRRIIDPQAAGKMPADLRKAAAPDLPVGEAGSAKRRAWVAVEILSKHHEIRWLVTCDRGLVELGAAEVDQDGPFKLKLAGRKVRFRPLPESLGEVAFSTEPIISQRWGRVYLIRLEAEKLGDRSAEKMYMRAVFTGHISGKQGWSW